MSFTPRHPTEIRLAVESAFDDSNLIDYSCAEIERLERELAEKVSAISDATNRIKFLEDGHTETSTHLIRAGIKAFGWNHEGVDKLAAERDTWKEAAEARAGAEEKLREVRAYAEKARGLLECVEREWPEVKGENSGLLWQVRSLLGMNPDPDTGKCVHETGDECQGTPPCPRCVFVQTITNVDGLRIDTETVRKCVHQSCTQPLDYESMMQAFEKWAGARPAGGALAPFDAYAAGARWGRTEFQVWLDDPPAPGWYWSVWNGCKGPEAIKVVYLDRGKLPGQKYLGPFEAPPMPDSQSVACTKQEGE